MSRLQRTGGLDHAGLVGLGGVRAPPPVRHPLRHPLRFSSDLCGAATFRKGRWSGGSRSRLAPAAVVFRAPDVRYPHLGLFIPACGLRVLDVEIEATVPTGACCCQRGACSRSVPCPLLGNEKKRPWAVQDGGQLRWEPGAWGHARHDQRGRRGRSGGAWELARTDTGRREPPDRRGHSCPREHDPVRASIWPTLSPGAQRRCTKPEAPLCAQDGRGEPRQLHWRFGGHDGALQVRPCRVSDARSLRGRAHEGKTLALRGRSEYERGSAVFRRKIESLSATYSHMRRTRG